MNEDFFPNFLVGVHGYQCVRFHMFIFALRGIKANGRSVRKKCERTISNSIPLLLESKEKKKEREALNHSPNLTFLTMPHGAQMSRRKRPAF